MMKKRIISILLVLCLALVMTCGVCATASGPELPYITDQAGLLNESQIRKLTQMAESIEDQYNVGVYIVSVEDYRSIDPTGAYEATYGIYHEYSMGAGAKRDGIMLLLSMKERDYALFCYGPKAEYAFNDYGQSKLEKVFLDNFSGDDWYGGFEDYVSECASYLEKAEAGAPVSKSPVTMILIFALVSLAIAGAVCMVLLGQMKSVHKKREAREYVVGGLNLTMQMDQFTHRTETRRKIERSGSSGGKSVSGGGGSGRSGKF